MCALERSIYSIENDGASASDPQISVLMQGTGRSGHPISISRRGDSFEAMLTGDAPKSSQKSVFHSIVDAVGWQDMERLQTLRNQAGVASPRGGGNPLEKMRDWLAELVQTNSQAQEILAPLLASESANVQPSAKESLFPTMVSKVPVDDISDSDWLSKAPVEEEWAYQSKLPRRPGEKHQVYARRLWAEYPDISKATVCSISNVRPELLADDPAFRSLTPSQRACSDANPRIENEGSLQYARRLRQLYPKLSIPDNAAIARVRLRHLTSDPKFKALVKWQETSSSEVPRLPRGGQELRPWTDSQKAYADSTPSFHGESARGHAHRLRDKYPDITDTDCCAVSGVSMSNLRSDPQLKPLTEQQQAILREIPREPLEPRKAHARRVIAKLPEISRVDLSMVSGVFMGQLADVLEIESLTAEQQRYLDDVPREAGESYLSHSRRVWEKHPTISDVDLHMVSNVPIGSLRGDLKTKPLTELQQTRLSRLPRMPGEPDRKYAHRAAKMYPEILGADLAAISGTRLVDLRRLGIVKAAKQHRQTQLNTLRPPAKEDTALGAIRSPPEPDATNPTGPEVSIKVEDEDDDVIMLPDPHRVDDDGPILADPSDPTRSLLLEVEGSAEGLRVAQWGGLKEAFRSETPARVKQIQEEISQQVRSFVADEGRLRARMSALMYAAIPVDESGDRGRALFAKVAIEPYTVLGPYAGKLLRTEEEMAAERKASGRGIESYFFATGSTKRVVSAFGAGNSLSLANSPTFHARTEATMARANIEVCRFGKNLNIYVARRPIAAEEELLIDYGETYEHFEPWAAPVVGRADSGAQPEAKRIKSEPEEQHDTAESREEARQAWQTFITQQGGVEVRADAPAPTRFQALEKLGHVAAVCAKLAPDAVHEPLRQLLQSRFMQPLAESLPGSFDIEGSEHEAFQADLDSIALPAHVDFMRLVRSQLECGALDARAVFEAMTSSKHAHPYLLRAATAVLYDPRAAQALATLMTSIAKQLKTAMPAAGEYMTKRLLGLAAPGGLRDGDEFLDFFGRLVGNGRDEHSTPGGRIVAATLKDIGVVPRVGAPGDFAQTPARLREYAKGIATAAASAKRSGPLGLNSVRSEAPAVVAARLQRQLAGEQILFLSSRAGEDMAAQSAPAAQTRLTEPMDQAAAPASTVMQTIAATQPMAQTRGGTTGPGSLSALS